MRRRALLAGVSAGVAGLAGCSTRSMDPTDTVTPVDPPSETPTDTPDDPDDDGPGIGAASIVDLRTSGRTYALAPLRYRSDDGAEVRLRFTATATADGPATVEASLTNENPFANTFRLEWTPPFGRPFSDIPHPMGDRYGDDDTYRAGLVFAPRGDHDLVDDPPEITRGSDGHWRLAGDPDRWHPERVRLDPGETVRGEYALVGRADGDGKGRPTGVYEFSRADNRPVRVTVWNTDAPGPDRESRFAGTSVPALPGDADTAWYHEADRTMPTFVRPSVERTELPARVEFTFANRSREPTSCGHWGLYKLHRGDWYHLGPFVRTADCRVVSPGDWKTWAVRAANGEMAPCEATSYAFLGGGRYAAVAGYGHATPRSAALVEFDAPPVEVVPTDDVTTARGGGTVTATSERWRTAPDDDHRSRVELVLESVDAADRTLVAEQVMRRRFRGLRNTLAFADGADRVVLRTDDRTADRAVGYDGGSLRFRFRGQAYVVSKASE